MFDNWRSFRSVSACLPSQCSGRLYTQGLLLCACAVEPAAAEPDRALSHRAVFESPRLPDPAAGGTVRPTHTHTCTLLQEKTSPWRQHHPQQVTIQAYSLLSPVGHCFTAHQCFVSSVNDNAFTFASQCGNTFAKWFRCLMTVRNQFRYHLLL